MLCQVTLAKVVTLCKLFECLVITQKNVDLSQDANKIHPIIATTFAFCFLWAIAGNIIDSNWDAFDTFMRNMFDATPEIKVSPFPSLLPPSPPI